MIEIKDKIVHVYLPDEVKLDEEVIVIENVQLPDDAPARMKILRAESKKWYLTIVYHETSKQPFALFCHTNNREKSATTSDAIERLLSLAEKKGIKPTFIEDVKTKCHSDPNTSKLTRVISLLLRHGVLIKNIVAEIDRMEDIYVGSFLFQVKKFLSNYIKDGEIVEGGACDEEGCGGSLIYSEGCFKCKDCGSSKCG